MSERTWLLRDRLAHVVADAPAPPATWASVIRRTAVVVAFFAVGIATGELSLTVLGAFGALQAGLMECALPFGALCRRLLLLTVVCTVTVFIAMVTGGTWWSVIVIAALAYVFGCTASLSPGALTIGISALALAVIFAGMPQTPHQAWVNATWVAFGIIVQSVTWLILWKVERRMLVSRALAIKIRSDGDLIRHDTVESRELILTHDASNYVAHLLSTAGFPAKEESALRRVFSDAVVVSRALVSWVVLQAPGAHDRMRVSLALEQQARELDDLPRGGSQEWRDAGTRPIQEAMDSLIAGTQALRTGQVLAPVPLRGPAVPVAATPPAPPKAYVAALLPGGRLSRHGLRMLIGLGVAETLTMLLPIQHSFWLPLTVVFTLRTDWSETVVRGLNRTLGNLAAVIALPALLMAFGGSQWMMIVPLTVLAAIMFRWFFGNYVIASFGLAGSVLVLDYTLNPDESLFAIRIFAAVLGALISLAVALAIPTWSSKQGPQQVDALTAALNTWHEHLQERFATGGVSDDELEHDMSSSRAAMMALEPTVNGALLEPGTRGRPVAMAMVLSAGTHVHTQLMAITCFVMTQRDPSHDVDTAVAVQRSRVQASFVDLNRALVDYRST